MIVIDELACKEDVASCRRISQQGVSLVATCHGVSLRSLIRNPDLNQLLGGLSTVTLGDKHAQCAPLPALHAQQLPALRLLEISSSAVLTEGTCPCAWVVTHSLRTNEPQQL